MDSISLPRGRHDLRLVSTISVSPGKSAISSALSANIESVADVVAREMPDMTYSRAAAGASLIETFSAFAQEHGMRRRGST